MYNSLSYSNQLMSNMKARRLTNNKLYIKYIIIGFLTLMITMIGTVF